MFAIRAEEEGMSRFATQVEGNLGLFRSLETFLVFLFPEEI